MYAQWSDVVYLLAQQEGEVASGTFDWKQTLITVLLTVVGSVVIAYMTIYLQDRMSKRNLLRALFVEVSHNASLAGKESKRVQELQGVFAPAGLKKLHTASYYSAKERGILADLPDDLLEQVFAVYDIIFGIREGRFDLDMSREVMSPSEITPGEKPISELTQMLPRLESNLKAYLGVGDTAKEQGKRYQKPMTCKLERRFKEGITAMTVGLTSVILGGTLLGLPRWSAWIFIPFGVLAYGLGLWWYRSSRR